MYADGRLYRQSVRTQKHLIVLLVVPMMLCLDQLLANLGKIAP